MRSMLDAAAPPHAASAGAHGHVASSSLQQDSFSALLTRAPKTDAMASSRRFQPPSSPEPAGPLSTGASASARVYRHCAEAPATAADPQARHEPQSAAAGDSSSNAPIAAPAGADDSVAAATGKTPAASAAARSGKQPSAAYEATAPRAKAASTEPAASTEYACTSSDEAVADSSDADSKDQGNHVDSGTSTAGDSATLVDTANLAALTQPAVSSDCKADAAIAQAACIKLQAATGEQGSARITDASEAGRHAAVATPAATMAVDLKALFDSLSAASGSLSPAPNPSADPSAAQPLPTPLSGEPAGSITPVLALTPAPGSLPTSAAAPAAPTAAPAPVFSTPLSSETGFVEQLGERVLMLGDSSINGLSSAKIELHPAELGSLVVHIDVQGNQAQVGFSADNPATRTLLQQSLPQLRELLGAQGLQLMRTRIEERQRNVPGGTPSPWSRTRGDGTATRRIGSIRLVDAYV